MKNNFKDKEQQGQRKPLPSKPATAGEERYALCIPAEELTGTKYPNDDELRELVSRLKFEICMDAVTTKLFIFRCNGCFCEDHGGCNAIKNYCPIVDDQGMTWKYKKTDLAVGHCITSEALVGGVTSNRKSREETAQNLVVQLRELSPSSLCRLMVMQWR